MVLIMRIVNTKESSMSNFREEVYELAFGDEAINKDYSDEEVLKKLFNDLQILQYYIEQYGDLLYSNEYGS
jgi:hypothetical protein